MEPVGGTARLDTSAGALSRVTALLKGKYGAEYRIVLALERLANGFRPKPRVVLRIS